ncbi:hypothetical protein J437_LFUL018079 [Ladona fulva]|uniref:N-acetyltransferase domain-containing protein n=1 Tax=Ladona fulva TaxID=123851 RepID=A0A8K0KJF2_LADFU|nr:hypothetical protein J437_LFUL018079 [Ladona fulva]
MEGSFVRSPNVPKGVRGRISTIRIDDIPDNRREEAIQHMIDYYMKEEPLASTLMKIAPFSDEDIHEFYHNALNDNISMYAVDEANNEEIAGVTMLRVASRCDPERHTKVDARLKSMQALFDFLHYCYDGIDFFTYKSGTSEVVVDHILEPMGLSVAPHYRGRGIGEAIIKARHELVTELGVEATLGIYTSIYSKPLILRQGMEIIKEIPFSDYYVDGKAIFAECNPPNPSAQVIGGLLRNDSA